MTTFPSDRRARLLLNTDAKNEADDQFAIVHALLTPTFDLHGIIAAHFGDHRSATSMQDSRAEIEHLLAMMELSGRVSVANGAPVALPNEDTPVVSPGAQMIIDQAMNDDPRPLHVAFLGPLTDMASALLAEPRLNDRNIICVWIGGGYWPTGGREFNLMNDIAAANVVMRSRIQVWQIPQAVYRMMAVGHAELQERCADKGVLGKYLVDQVFEWNERWHKGPIEYRSLGDTPAVSVILNPNGGLSQWRPAPEFSPQMHYVHTGKHRPIRVYETLDTRYILEDFYAKLGRFHRGVQDLANFG